MMEDEKLQLCLDGPLYILVQWVTSLLAVFSAS